MDYEVREMKDDLSLLAWELEGRDKELINKTLKYIEKLENELVEVSNDKDKAKKLLRDNGYLIIKLTQGQIADSELCERMSEQGKYMECVDCSCNCCLVQQW
ncbi:hypothetical protein [Clostridium culturomicium]|uniref:hypothetical protein n=1 Tax=Clostridium culturomicium TaxID=1499683 RepID=UPI003857235E